MIVFTYFYSHSIMISNLKNKKESTAMKEKTIFPREERSEVLFKKILNDPWACNQLFQTFCSTLFCNEDSDATLTPLQFSEALFKCYTNKDLSALLMALTNNTLFDLLRNSFLIPYRFNADGKQNPVIMTDDQGLLLPKFKNKISDKEYRHFYNIYKHLDNKKNIYLAQAYRYSHAYDDDPSIVKQEVLEKKTGILVIRELPDSVKMKETESEAYSAIWDLMIACEKNLPMSFIFYGQDTIVDHDEHFDELGIFLPNSHFLKNLEHHVKKAEAVIYGQN